MASDTKHFIVIGLGSFGTALARRLAGNGCRVTGIDSNRERVERLKDELYEPVIGDATDRNVVKHLPFKDSAAVFISLGEDITRSLLATLHVKELGARQIVVKGVTHEHGRILKSLGVDRVIFPETEIAEQLADKMTWPNVLDYLKIDPEYSIVEIALPSSFAGQSLAQINVRQRFDVSVVGVKDALSGELHVLPRGDFKLQEDQVLVVVGRAENLRTLREID